MPTKTGHRRGTRQRRTGWAAFVVVAMYTSVCAVGCAIQESIIFPQSAEEAVDRRVPPDAELVWVATEDGHRVEGWFFKGNGRAADNPGPAVMFFHGNNEVLDHCLEYAEMYPPWGVSVLLVEYRGYGRSGGKPTQAGIGRDMDAFHQWLVTRPGVDPAMLVYHGRSLGAAVAADLASRHPPRAMILASAFTSMSDMFWRYWVPGFIVRHPFDVLSVVEQFDGPILLLHGTRDDIVPVSHGRRLARVAKDATLIEVDAKHDLPADWVKHEQRIVKFIAQIGAEHE